MSTPISQEEWEFRRNICIAMLNMILDDIARGNYSALGRPNCTSVQLALAEPIDDVRQAWSSLGADFKAALRVVEEAIERQQKAGLL